MRLQCWVRALVLAACVTGVTGVSASVRADVLFEQSLTGGLGAFSSAGRVSETSTGAQVRGGLFAGSITSPSISTLGYQHVQLELQYTAVGLDEGEAAVVELAVAGGTYAAVAELRTGGTVQIDLGAAASEQSDVVVRIATRASSLFEYVEVQSLALLGDAGSGGGGANPPSSGDFVTFESGQVRPLALSSDGQTLYAVNTPDNRVELFDVSGTVPRSLGSVRVGLEPVALGLLDDSRLWVVNHLSDSVSIVDVSVRPAVVVQTLLVGDEPRDVVFAGPGNRWAFVTAAHRGQNVPFDPQLTTAGVGRTDVWVFDTAGQGTAMGGEPVTILSMFGDTPRGLARDASGERVFAAVFNSGNRTTVLTDDIGLGGIAKAGPSRSADGVTQPATGLIVQFDGQNWVDGGDPQTSVAPQVWSDRVNLELPDYDVFVIDASGSMPQVSGQISGVGTTLFNLAVNPQSGAVYVSNQEALNVNRFEGPGTRSSTVRGHHVESRITVLRDGQVNPRHLNKHIDYSTDLGSPSERERSLAIPLQMAVSSDGQDLFVVAMGSDKLARFATGALEDNSFVPDTANQLVLSGGGPTGVVLDEARARAFVLTRFDNGLSVIGTQGQLTELAHQTMFNPEPEVVQTGRRFLYDATYTSSRGDSSCAGCHIFGDMDHLSWDLGNPDGTVQVNPTPYNENVPFFGRVEELHPMKGPMTTQSLRGLRGNGPMHWRGDRTGVDADGDETLEEQSFEDFNVAMVDLLGRATELTESEMDAFARFALELTYPPNPVANLDNSLTTAQANGLQIYNNVVSDTISTCNGCHRLNALQGQFGTDGTMAIEGPGVAEDMKIPHLRNIYQKVGMFATNTRGAGEFLGPQIRGFGYDNSGAAGSVFEFLSAPVFTLNDADTRLVEQVSLAFPSEMNPIVGQQVTVTVGNRAQSDVSSRLQLLVERARVTAPRPECDLVAVAVLDGQERAWVMNGQGSFVPDAAERPAATLTELLGEAAEVVAPVTFTCVPPGNGTRIAIDRDVDNVRDGDEG